MNVQLQTVPAQLVIGFINDSFVRVLNLEGCRLTFEHDKPVAAPLDIMLLVFNYKEYSYDRFEFKQCSCADSQENEFSYIYTIILKSESTDLEQSFAQRIGEIASMLDFARNKTLEDPEEMLRRMDAFANYLPVYPRKLETRFEETYVAQLRDWFDLRLVPEENEEFASIASEKTMAFSLSRKSLYKKFCEASSIQTAINEILEEQSLLNHGLFTRPVSRLYIGNEFCSHLFPLQEQLDCLLAKANQEGMGITICTSFVAEDQLNAHTRLLDRLHEWSRSNRQTVEVVCNDWGLVHYIHRNNLQLTPVLGRLLNKRKKDPRQQWQFGRERYSRRLSENSLNQPHFRSFLENYGILRYEFESHLSPNLVPQGNHSLHFPYFQMNTSHYCPLYAECRFYNRAAQRKVTNCPNYCEEFIFLYPTHLNVIGWGNTLFGFNRQSLRNPVFLKDTVTANIDRLVFSP